MCLPTLLLNHAHLSYRLVLPAYQHDLATVVRIDVRHQRHLLALGERLISVAILGPGAQRPVAVKVRILHAVIADHRLRIWQHS